MKATANGDTTRVVCKVRARVRLSRVRASHIMRRAIAGRGWPDFGFQLKFCSLSLFWFFGRLISFFFTQKPTKPTENTRLVLGSVTSVCLEGAYAHYHPEVVDILFWAVLLEW